jgi:hypothetical protein
MIAAAVAEVNKGIFVTDNEKHFQGINLIKSPPALCKQGTTSVVPRTPQSKRGL